MDKDPIEQQEPVKKLAGKKQRWPAKIFLVLFFIFIVMQFFQPSKNNNNVEIKNDISSLVTVPDTVQQILKVACYDCHSNDTNYPWYINIQPVGWWMDSHIEDGKRHLNFSEFVIMPPRKGKSTQDQQLKKLEEIKEEMEDGEMPLTSYTLLHKDSRLTKEQKQMIYDWSDSARNQLSLLGKK